MQEERKTRKRWSYFKTRLESAFLVVATVLLLTSVVGVAVWRAMGTEEYQATPTIPADIQPGLAYVSALAGRVESQTPDSEVEVLSQGDTIVTGEGYLVRVAENGWLRLGLQDGSTIFVDEDSELELQQMADSTNPETVLLLHGGRLLVSVGPGSPTLVVRAETGAQVRAEDGIAGIIYQPAQQYFDVHCLEGECMVLGKEEPGRLLRQGERGGVQGAAEPIAAGASQYELFQMLGDVGLIATPTRIPVGVTVTAFPTLDIPSPTQMTVATTTTEPAVSTPASSPTLPLPSPTPAPSRTATSVSSPTTSPTLIPSPTGTSATATPLGATPVTATPSRLTATPTPFSGTPTGTATPVGALLYSERLALAEDWLE